MNRLKQLYKEDLNGFLILILFSILTILEAFNYDLIISFIKEVYNETIMDLILVSLGSIIFPLGLSILIYKLLWKR